LAADNEEDRYAMIFETKIKELSDHYLADARVPDITGFVDQLFQVAAETGTVACVFDGDKKLRFFARPPRIRMMGLAPAAVPLPAACIVEHEAARSVLRMICARLGVLCKERTATDISPYGDKAVMEYDVQDHRRWSVSFTNTPDRQEFLIEAV
jgi:hypothetical protein